MHKVLMFGGTEWSEWGPIRAQLRRLVKKHGANQLLVISGGAPGADTMCAEVARSMSVHVAEVRALWDTRHRGAGPQRNSVMVALEPHEAISFGGDRGTADTTRKLTKAGIKHKRIEE